eukprot:CAMPEP_0196813808 /NCGR_PEP_ID=MMETSP1362-20130617/39468_1 /TAXON_ID=163516 /ORGANISM="Leptocylindrus danicus, Strain CCMP1856" /LENGTH=183 /DNA_ID=CAMNT_0042190205 /DNA_START=64 /DNA_END=612 /DNA_ORIENTATION=+
MASKFLDAIKFNSVRTEEGILTDVESTGVGEESVSSSSGRWPLLQESFSFGSGVSEDPPEDSFELCPALTYQQRVIGMGSCLAIGYLIGFGSFLRFKDLMLGDPFPFVLAFTAGNLISLSGSFFLSGPKTQMKKMFHETRKHATIIYLASIVCTLMVAFAPQFPGQAFVLFLMCILQTLSLTW